MNTVSQPRPTPQAPPGRPTHQLGMVMLTLLIALALGSVALMGALDVWAFQRQRLQEEQLLFVGNQYRLAIQRYYQVGRSLPTSIDDLLEDKRFPIPLHHLRRAYPDPITGKNDWQFLIAGNRLYGVYSRSTAQTIKRANFPVRYAAFANAETYDGWRFFYLPGGNPSPTSTPQPNPPATTQTPSAAIAHSDMLGSVSPASPFSH